MSKKTLNTPTGSLNYTFISGDGRESLSGVAQFSTQLVLTADEAEPLISEINTLWVNSGIKKQPKSMGYKTLEDGNIAFNFKTNVEINGRRNSVKVYDAKGKEADFSDILIGNGTIGRVGATIAVYNAPTGSGVSAYLNKIQVIKLVEYTGGDDGFDEVEGGEYEFETEFESTESAPTEQKTWNKPAEPVTVARF